MGSSCATRSSRARRSGWANRYFAIAAKHKDRDDLVILDVPKDKEVRRIPLPLNGLTTPSWSPDGLFIAFARFAPATVREGGEQIYLIRSTGGTPTKLTSGLEEHASPSW